MYKMKWAAIAPLVSAAALLVVPLLVGTAEAQVNKEMGKIVSTDWRKMKIEISNPRGRVKTWDVARDCTVKFTDGKEQFPNPKLSDLREPMYVWFFYRQGTITIESIEVRELGFDAGQGEPGAKQKGVITNLDADIGHVELDLGQGPQTFLVKPKRQLRAFRRGQRVIVIIDSRGPQEIVTKITPQR
jgi:hypothetical protein